MAFRRLVSLRGHPAVCWSDCGTNFKGAQGYIAETTKNWNIKQIMNRLSNDHSCQFIWEWNIPRASHMNGVVESVIKSVRQASNATCKDRPFTEEQWRTFLTEITYMVNSRPLYPSSSNIWESPPITPNDLLIGPHITPPAVVPEERVNPRHLFKNTNKRIDECWVCWKKYRHPSYQETNGSGQERICKLETSCWN